MKIIFLQDDFPPRSMGGAGFSTYELALGMKRLGHDVQVITACREISEAGEREYNGLKIFNILSNYAPRWRSWRSVYNPSVLRRVESILQEGQYDVVHINNIHTHLSYHCFKIAKKHARAVVFTARDTMAFTYGKLDTVNYLKHLSAVTTWRDHVVQAKKGYNPFRNFFIKRYLQQADSIITVSDSLKKAFLEHGITNVSVIHTGADVSKWQSSAEEIEKFKITFQLQGKRVILFGGRLSEGKGGRKSVEALAKISASVPNTVLLVAGKVDTYAEEMKVMAQRLGIGDQLVFTGWIENEMLKTAYAAADVVLVPSLYLDPFPRIVIEAMASGKAVVGTCYGGAPEIIKDGVTGYVVNPFEGDSMAAKIIDVLQHPQKAEQFGLAGRERVKEDFNIEDTVKQYIVVYELLTQNGK